MPMSAIKVICPFQWTELDEALQTEILKYTTRRFVMQSKHITLCFERPMHSKLFEPRLLIIKYTDSSDDSVFYELTNVGKIRIYNTFPEPSPGLQSSWMCQFYCKNKAGSTDIPEIHTKYIVGNFALQAMIHGLTGSLSLHHRDVDGGDEFFI